MLTRTIICCTNVFGICHYVGNMVRYIERGVRVLGSSSYTRAGSELSIVISSGDKPKVRE